MLGPGIIMEHRSLRIVPGWWFPCASCKRQVLLWKCTLNIDFYKSRFCKKKNTPKRKNLNNGKLISLTIFICHAVFKKSTIE